MFFQSISPVSGTELSKMGELIVHYNEHHKESDMSFFEFLDLHYGWGKNAEEHDKKEPHDGQFPFHGTLVFHQIVLDSPRTTARAEAVSRPFGLAFLVPHTLGSVIDFPRVVFQPPKA